MTARPQPAAQCPVRGHTTLPPQRPLPIYGAAFDADPQASYRRLREQGPVVPVEISPDVFGYLAVTYQACVYLLRHTPELFAKDPTYEWAALRAGQIPPDSPALQMMMPRDNALWKDGPAHERLRGAITSALTRIDTYALADTVARVADRLIEAFLAAGRADLIAQYADPLPMLTVIELFGCPPEDGALIIQCVTRLFAAGPDAAQANAELEAACLNLVRLKRTQPGRDVVTYLIQAGLSDAELVQTLLLLFGAAAPPTAKHIGRTLQRLLTSERFAGSVHTGVTPVATALEEVLWTEPPVPNYSPLYARGRQYVEGVLVEPGYPIIISFAAANSDPAVTVDYEDRVGNRAHIAFSAGVHGCPAPGLARVISETAIEHLLDRLPALTLTIPADEVTELSGTFLAGPASLPVRFQPARTGR
ncbi:MULTISPECIES: cytochrome P450 family protein [Streptomyces]|uniref:Cytochrome P450 n=1 Tax=Streptomyces griseiscabiei TaxID=2993540 RepID=A0ABU4LDW7_9ACTN|nr:MULTISPECIES: cytochrome P450 [Streptomyces]MBZ3908431.1 cytochrome P450 [Streptomyces griseiscabiei]MDX2913949.1 cytochrome P450 [Streptomyces griseiscabiei]